MLVGGPLNDWSQVRHAVIMPASGVLHPPPSCPVCFANGLHLFRLSRHVLGTPVVCEIAFH